MEQWQSVRHNFQATSVRPVLWHKVQIPHTFVVTRVRASQTLSKANARRLNTPASARCPVVAKRVEKTATPTEVRWGGKGLPDTSQEWDAKKRGVEPRVRCRGKAHERDANKGATSGTERCAANRIAVDLVPECPIDPTEDAHLLPNLLTTVDGNFETPRIPLKPSTTQMEPRVLVISDNPPNLPNKLDGPTRQCCGEAN